jgi:hypothetical protein
VQHDPTPAWGPDRRDLDLLYGHGRAIAEDHLIPLLADAVEHAAALLYRDATTRLPEDGMATRKEVEERIGAALLGAASALACAARNGPG